MKFFFVIDCSLCQLGNYFSESNGYGCFESMDDLVACTCPDGLYTQNLPCRKIYSLISREKAIFPLGICDRNNICGDDPSAFCAETAPSSLGVQTNDTYYFACFCSDMTFRVGEACSPSEIFT